MMSRRFPCPYLGGEVDLTEERERHITERHPDLLPEHRERIARPWPTLITSVLVPGSAAPSCWLAGILTCDKASTSVLVVSERTPQERHWIITAYLARKLAQGETEWQRA